MTYTNPMTKLPILHVKTGANDLDSVAAAIVLANALTGVKATDSDIAEGLAIFELPETPENIAAVRGKLTN